MLPYTDTIEIERKTYDQHEDERWGMQQQQKLLIVQSLALLLTEGPPNKLISFISSIRYTFRFIKIETQLKNLRFLRPLSSTLVHFRFQNGSSL